MEDDSNTCLMPGSSCDARLTVLRHEVGSVSLEAGWTFHGLVSGLLQSDLAMLQVPIQRCWWRLEGDSAFAMRLLVRGPHSEKQA